MTSLSKIKALKELVRHMWIHESYMENGYWHMTGEQKSLYRAIIRRTHQSLSRDRKAFLESIKNHENNTDRNP